MHFLPWCCALRLPPWITLLLLLLLFFLLQARFCFITVCCQWCLPLRSSRVTTIHDYNTVCHWFDTLPPTHTHQRSFTHTCEADTAGNEVVSSEAESPSPPPSPSHPHTLLYANFQGSLVSQKRTADERRGTL